jgi:hypothetical protein
MKPESRDALLAAIAKARKWIDDIRLGRSSSFAEIAKREALCERHIRLLAPLAFLSPRIIAAIVEATAPADLTVTGLANALPYSWAEQEQRIGLLCSGGVVPVAHWLDATLTSSQPLLNHPHAWPRTCGCGGANGGRTAMSVSLREPRL